MINEKKPELEEATHVLNYRTEIVEFKTYVRENAESVRVHLFEPLNSEQISNRNGQDRSASQSPSPKPGEVTSQPEYTLPLLESLIELGGSAKMSEVLDKIYTEVKDRLKPKDSDLLSAALYDGKIKFNGNATTSKMTAISKKTLLEVFGK